MGSLHSGRWLAGSASVSIDQAVANFEARWGPDEPNLDRYWASLGASRSVSVLSALVKSDLRKRFESGQQPRAAEYLERYPELAADGDRVVSVVYEEFCLLQEQGADPDSQEFCEGYAPWRDSLLSQLAYHRELSQVVGVKVPETKYPRVGDRFEKYRLCSVLGTGGAARVYLATEEDLGGRKVALKVSASVGHEPSILANLDHRYIVPILTVARSEEGLRGFCMPYRPGVTLEELIRRIGRGTPPKNARAIREALEPSDSIDESRREEDRAGWSGFPTTGTFPEAVAWIGMALASALSYLHGRDVLHRDIKPANILLSFREGPQLLDFNLAHAPHAAEHAQAALKGGTLPYMAPEQLRAFVNKAVWDDVGSGADVFALGLVLREMLTGQPPEIPEAGLPLPRAIQALHDRRSDPPVSISGLNPRIPPALDSIIGKCLAFDPLDRYASASDFGEDLQRFLDRRPLRFAPNTSLMERGANWVQRHRVLSVGVFFLFLLYLAIRPGRAPQPIPDLPEFRSAVESLDSTSRDRWLTATETFGRLHRDYPKSAWPSLYQGLAFEKLGKAKEANDSIKKAGNCPDFEESLHGRLKEDKHSLTVLMNLGRQFIMGKHFKEAYDTLMLANQIGPDRPIILVNLADVERKTGRTDDATRHISRAIEIAEPKQTLGVKTMIEWREVLLPLLVKQADRILDESKDPKARSNVRNILDILETNLRAFERDWRTRPEFTGGGSFDALVHFYQGYLFSGRAVLAADGGEFDEARRLFETGIREFDEALKADLKGTPDSEEIRREVKAKKDQAIRRRDQFAPSSSVNTRRNLLFRRSVPPWIVPGDRRPLGALPLVC